MCVSLDDFKISCCSRYIWYSSFISSWSCYRCWGHLCVCTSLGQIYKYIVIYCQGHGEPAPTLGPSPCLEQGLSAVIFNPGDVKFGLRDTDLI